MSTLLDRVNARITELAAQRDAIDAELAAIEDDPEARGFDSTEAALARVAELRTEGAALNAQIEEANARAAELASIDRRNVAAAPVRALNVGGATVRSEPLTYTAENRERSFFVDAYRAQFTNDPDAQERIQRHQREASIERRDITTSTLNGLIPPLYLLDQAATLARAGRPFANAIPSYPVPTNGMTLTVTRVTTGTATAAQTSQNTAAHEVDMVTTDFTVPIVTVMGQQDVSRQAIERGAITDALIFADLTADHATKWDAQCLYGTGSNGQATGIIAQSGIGTDSYAGTTVAAFNGSINAALSRVASNRYAPADVIVMHPRRWHWLLSKSDSNGRPLVVPNAQIPQNAQGVGATAASGFAGTFAGLPVIVDANIPLTYGTSTDEDRVLVTRLADLVQWEGPLMTFSFDQAVNPPATIRLAVSSYAAFTAGRYPTGTSMVQGTGLVAPTYG